MIFAAGSSARISPMRLSVVLRERIWSTTTTAGAYAAIAGENTAAPSA